MSSHVPDSVLPGARYRATHQASVDAILSTTGEYRKVTSAGSDFVNVDNWYIRMLAGKFCEWMKENQKNNTVYPGNDVELLIKKSNSEKVNNRYIRIAETPDRLPPKVATALIGSAYHEAWHTKYSNRTQLKSKDIHSILRTRWDKAPWGELADKLLLWMNLVEDIRIERVGCAEFAGVQERMEDLQDFVLGMERRLFDRKGITDLDCLIAMVRDFGKGYQTEAVSVALEYYKTSFPAVYWTVTAGTLTPFVTAASKLGPGDDLSCLSLAMDILITLENLANSPEECKKASDNIKSEVEGDGGDGSAGPSAKAIQDMAKGALREQGTSAMDHSDALSKIIKEIADQLGVKSSLDGDQIYRPFSTSFDKIVKVKARDSSDLDVNLLQKAVRNETNYLRTRLRHLFKATELVEVEHGVRKGRHVSNRMVAESVAMTRSGSAPDRPFYEAAEAPDLSMSAVIMVDESESMVSRRHGTCMTLMCLAESLESIGCKTAVAGFMVSHPTELYQLSLGADFSESVYHRVHGMTYHVFKGFDERFSSVKSRFGSINSSGDTPMGDGLNFGISLLSPRNEGHRFIFMLTDGQPDDHGPVKNRIAMAKSLGIKTIAVGLGDSAQYVQEDFPDSVWARDIEDIPALLVKKITAIVEKNEMRRGKRLSKEDLVR